MKYWIYELVTTLLTLPIRIFIRKINIEGEENFPKDKPVILACNHPNSFFDGVVFEYHYHNKRRIFSLARGDAFNKPLANKVLRSMRLLPIFRARDARKDKARAGNQKTNDECYELFKKNDSILIFIEGSAYPEKHLRGLKRGTANMAISMAEKSNYQMDLYIVPTAINYSSFGTLRRTIHLSYSKPIKILDYKDRIEAEDKSLVTEITDSINDSLQATVVQTKEELTDEKEFLHEIMINENNANLTYLSKGSWNGNIEKLNNLKKEDANLVNLYKKEMEQHNIEDANVADSSFDYISFIIAMLTFAVSLPVYLIWLLISKLLVYYCNKKITNPIFIDSVIVGSLMIFSFILSIGVFVYFLNTTPSWWSIVFTIASLYGALSWFRMVDEIPFLWKELKWLGLKDEIKSKIKEQRRAILALISND